MMVAERVAGRGRQSAEVQSLRDCRDELHALRAEAVAFVDRVIQPASELARAGSYLSPRLNLAGHLLIRDLDRYRARHTEPTDGETAA